MEAAKAFRAPTSYRASRNSSNLQYDVVANGLGPLFKGSAAPHLFLDPASLPVGALATGAVFNELGNGQLCDWSWPGATELFSPDPQFGGRPTVLNHNQASNLRIRAPLPKNLSMLFPVYFTGNWAGGDQQHQLLRIVDELNGTGGTFRFYLYTPPFSENGGVSFTPDQRPGGNAVNADATLFTPGFTTGVRTSLIGFTFNRDTMTAKIWIGDAADPVAVSEVGDITVAGPRTDLGTDDDPTRDVSWYIGSNPGVSEVTPIGFQGRYGDIPAWAEDMSLPAHAPTWLASRQALKALYFMD